MDHYKVLEVSKDATSAEIKAAYRSLASKHHPDKGGDHDTFVEIQLAYDTLGDDAKREHYDRFGSAGDEYTKLAEELIAGLFANAVSQFPTNHDIVGVISTELDHRYYQVSSTVRQFRSQVRKYRLGLGRLVSTSNSSLVRAHLTAHLRQKVIEWQAQRRARSILQRARLLIEDYAYEFTPPPEVQPRPSFGISASSAWPTYTL